MLYERPMVDIERRAQWFAKRYNAASHGTPFFGVCDEAEVGVACMVRNCFKERPPKPSEGMHHAGLCWMADGATGAIEFGDADTEEVQIKCEILARLFRQHFHRPVGWSLDEFKLLRAKWRANAFGRGQLYLAASKFNHDCAANAAFDERDSKRSSFVATANIAEGREVTLNYVDDIPFAKPEEGDDDDEAPQIRLPNRDILRRAWGFDCNCKLCQKEAAAAQEQTAADTRAAEPEASASTAW